MWFKRRRRRQQQERLMDRPVTVADGTLTSREPDPCVVSRTSRHLPPSAFLFRGLCVCVRQTTTYNLWPSHCIARIGKGPTDRPRGQNCRCGRPVHCAHGEVCWRTGVGGGRRPREIGRLARADQGSSAYMAYECSMAGSPGALCVSVSAYAGCRAG